MDNGKSCEIFLPTNPCERLKYENGFCEFVPVGWMRAAGGWHPVGYKLVTEEMMSLGLRNNPTPMQFSMGEWQFEERNMHLNADDEGGIWTALKKGSLKTLAKHCEKTWGMKTRGFLTAICNPVYANSYRIKSQGVMLLKEISL